MFASVYWIGKFTKSLCFQLSPVKYPRMGIPGKLVSTFKLEEEICVITHRSSQKVRNKITALKISGRLLWNCCVIRSVKVSVSVAIFCSSPFAFALETKKMCNGKRILEHSGSNYPRVSVSKPWRKFVLWPSNDTNKPPIMWQCWRF